MKQNVSIKKNFIMNTILTMSAFIFPLITFPYISRILLPTGVGKVSLATSVITYFSMFSQLGIPTYGIRICAQVREDKDELSKVTQELLIINMITCIFTYVAFFVTVFNVGRFSSEKSLYIVMGLTIFLNMVGMEWLYKGLEKYSYITIRSIIFKAIAVVCMFAMVHAESDYVIYGGISVLAASASNVLNLLYAHNYVDFKPLKNYNFKRHLRPILIFFAMSCATTIYVNLDTIMLGMMKSDAEIGYYNAAVKIRTVLLSVVTSLGAVLLPRASYYVKNNMMDEFKRINKKAMSFTIIVAIPLTIFFILFAKQGILFLSGDAFDGAILPMQFIMPTVLLAGMSNITGIEVLIPLGKEKIVLYSEVAGAITDLIINFILIPILGCTGAAIGTTVAEFIVLFVQIMALKDISKMLFKNISYTSILVATILSCVSVWWLVYASLNAFSTLLISSILFSLVYFVVLFILKEPLVRQLVGVVLEKVEDIKCKK